MHIAHCIWRRILNIHNTVKSAHGSHDSIVTIRREHRARDSGMQVDV
jgi:hypothetical protein